MAKVIGYSGVELPVDEAVYDDNHFLLDKKQIDANFRAGMYKGMTLEQQNGLREYVGLPALTEDTQNPKPARKFADMLKTFFTGNP